MIVNTMIGKSGGGGDVTIQATELTIDSSDVVHIKFPGLPAGATVKNLCLSGLTNAYKWTVYSDAGSSVAAGSGKVIAYAQMLSSGSVRYYTCVHMIATTYIAHTLYEKAYPITVGDGEITFSKPAYTPGSSSVEDGYYATSEWTLELGSSRLAFITYST